MYFISRYSKLTELGLSMPPWARWLASVAVLVAITGIWYVGAYGVLHARLLDRAYQAQALAEQQSVQKALAHKAEQLESAVNAQKAAWDATVQSAQKQAGHDRLFALFDAFGKQGIAVQGYYPRGSVDRSWYSKSSAQIHFSASFDQLLAVFDALNKQNVPYRCEQVRLERRDNQIFAVITVNLKTPKGDGNGKA